MKAVKSLNLLLRFLLELGVLVVFGYWGIWKGEGTLVKVGLGIGSLLACAIVWGVFLAPASSTRLKRPWTLVLELCIFGLAGAALYDTGQPFVAELFTITYLVNKILISWLRAEMPVPELSLP